MRRIRLATLLTTGILLSAIIAGPVSARPSPAPIRAQGDTEPQLLFTALQLADHVRYTVTLLRPLSTTATNVRVEVLLPAGSELSETLQTQGRSVFLSSEGNTLSWAAPSYEPGDPVDAFTFRLTRPLGGAAQVHVSWEVDGQPGRHEIMAAPPIEIASAAAGEAILQTGIQNRPIGETGVRVEFNPESGLEGVELRLRKPGPEANPPAGVGSPWWCAALALEGLPAGASLFVVVPLRQPLPPGARVDLFAESGSGWEPLEDQGQATADGQFVAFRHPGGTVAAGVATRLQPIATSSTLTLAQRTPKLRLTVSGTQSFFGSRTIRNHLTVSEVGGAPAQRVSVRFDFPSGFQLNPLLTVADTFTCGPTLPISASSSKWRVCEWPSIAAGASTGFDFFVVSDNQVGGTLRITAFNNTNPNAPDNPTTTDSILRNYLSAF
jgi:hypothetical protein